MAKFFENRSLTAMTPEVRKRSLIKCRYPFILNHRELTKRATSAKPIIRFHADHLYLYQGRLEVVGYFENTGDETAYVNRYEFDLFITAAGSGRQLWTNYCTRHYVNSVKVPAGRRASYTINIRIWHIPGYKGCYRWWTKNVRTYWNKRAG